MTQAPSSKPRCAGCGQKLDLILYVPGDRCAKCLDEQVDLDRALEENREHLRLDEKLRERPR